MTNQSITLSSQAKINWFLHVGETRPDGYHELQTLFQTISFADELYFQTSTELECHISGFSENVPLTHNLVYQAWDLMRKNYKEQAQGLDVRTAKILPMGGGLGGGSSNAAATLNAINQLWNLNLPPTKLEKLAGQLGSDVPFFIRGGIALGTGRGEILEHLPSMPTYHLALILPDQPMPTVEGYRLLDSVQRVSLSPHTVSQFLTNLRGESPTKVAESFLPNDFELVANQFSWYQEACQLLKSAGALKTFLCGSGSTVAALAQDENHARIIAELTNGIYAYTTNANP